jgi:uncharacterized protein
MTLDFTHISATVRSAKVKSLKETLLSGMNETTRSGIVETWLSLAFEATRAFYQKHSEIKASHGWDHVSRVYEHSRNAVIAITQQQPHRVLSSTESMEIHLAALLHDVDDVKYVPGHDTFQNARRIINDCGVPASSLEKIVDIISWVCCSKNGNRIPEPIQMSGEYHRLIPRCADRLEAAGAVGVVRSYQYNQENGQPLFSTESPRARTVDQVWELATPERFEAYLKGGGKSTDMISHYYDKLLHIARPQSILVRNPYLEEKEKESSNELVEVCVRFGKTGEVDEQFIQNLSKELGL